MSPATPRPLAGSCIDRAGISLMKAFTEPPPVLDFVWPGLIAGTVGALIAAGGTGKSFCILEAAMAVACGVASGDLLGIAPSRAGRVIYFAAEDPEPVLMQRAHAIGQRFSQPVRQAVATNLEVVPALGGRLDVMDATQQAGLIARCAGARLIVMDTLSRIHVKDENSNGDMAQLIGALEHIAANTGAAVVFLHHIAKSRGRDSSNSPSDQQQAARGASALTDNSRWCAHMSMKDDNEILFGECKRNYGSPEPDRRLQRQSDGVLILANAAVVTNIRRVKRAQA